MKFGQQLSTHLTPEWRKQYINYQELKSMLYDMALETPVDKKTDTNERECYFTQVDEKFFAVCELELTKINLFFSQKIAQAQGKFHELMLEMDAYKQLVELKAVQKHSSTATFKPEVQHRYWGVYSSKDLKKEQTKSARQLKFACSEYYLSLVLLQNYQQLNVTGFRKILKKHDKLVGNERGLNWRVSRVEKSPFFQNSDIERLISNTEIIVINDLEDGNRQAGMKRLKVPPLSEKQHAGTTFLLGLYLGCFIPMAVVIVLSLVLSIARPREPKWLGVRLFRGFIMLFADIWLVGLNMYGWAQAGVNHVLIFEIDPRQHLTYQSLMKISSLLCMIWALCVLGYLFAPTFGASPLLFPLILMFICVVCLLNPLSKPEGTFHRSSRFWLLRHCFHCFTAPLHRVIFADFWLADQMNSLVTCFLDLHYFVCFYATEVDYTGWAMRPREFVANITGDSDIPWGSIHFNSGHDMCMSASGMRILVCLLPATVRLLQCLRRFYDTRGVHPHLVNAGKYATTYFVVLFGTLYHWLWTTPASRQSMGHLNSPLFYLWMAAYVVSFAYTFLWDVVMDWGLFDPKAPNEARFLREEMIYGSRFLYYAAIVEDFLLRLSWVMNVSLGEVWTMEADMLMCITAPFELFRRFLWNYLRLENEHVNNCGQFRAVRDISVKPIRKGDLDLIIDKMDHIDWVSHRAEQIDNKIVRKRRAAKLRMKRQHMKRVLPSFSRLSKTAFGEQSFSQITPGSADI